MLFAPEVRRRIVEHRMQELGISSLAEVARRADVDRGNFSSLLKGRLSLSRELRDRVADVLKIDRGQFEELFAADFDLASVRMPLDLWRDLRGSGAMAEREVEKRRLAKAQRPPPKVSPWHGREFLVKKPGKPPTPPPIG
jgi:hypothetical protein